jgi:NADP-dependent 3-hydroxy acid dehydrogenase YdfG
VIKDGFPTLMVNNAGVARGGQFQLLTLEEFDWVLRVNFRAAVGLTHHLLPALLRSPGSHIVNVSSVYGLVTRRGQSAYVATKFALRGFSDVLRVPPLRRKSSGPLHAHQSTLPPRGRSHRW